LFETELRRFKHGEGMQANPSDAIRFEDLTVRYATKAGVHTVLDNFDLAVRDQEFLSLVGPSGCGKSTVLRLAAGLIQPAAGRVVLSEPPNRRGFERVAIVFQRPNLLPWLNVVSNILYPVRVLRRVSREDVDRAMALLDLVGMSKWSRSAPEELSGGMQQRVAICRALVLDPAILLMDEPFSALDALTREELQLELRRLHQSTRKTTLFITHSVNEAILLSDRIAVMSTDRGRLRDVCAIEFEDRNEDVTSLPAFHVYARRIKNGIYGREVQTDARSDKSFEKIP
jgi:NitT/TauT family transport system ATP-binding protein